MIQFIYFSEMIIIVTMNLIFDEKDDDNDDDDNDNDIDKQKQQLHNLMKKYDW